MVRAPGSSESTEPIDLRLLATSSDAVSFMGKIKDKNRKRRQEKRRLQVQKRKRTPVLGPSLDMSNPAVVETLQYGEQVYDAFVAGEAATLAMLQDVHRAMANVDVPHAACARGCSWCCRGVQVDVSPPEAAFLAGWLRESFAGEELQQLENALAANAARVSRLSTEERWNLQLPCVFLAEDGSCRVYAARPLGCRREHSLDASACQSLEHVPIPRDPVSHASLFAPTTATGPAAACAGLQPDFYELVHAVRVALENPAALVQWLAGEDAFAAARRPADDPESDAKLFGWEHVDEVHQALTRALKGRLACRSSTPPSLD